MTKHIGRPFADTRLVEFIERRILELRPRKSQLEIAEEAGFSQRTMLANIKAGTNKLPLDRVPGLADALECDPALLFKLALEQLSGNSTVVAIERIFGVVVTANEADWIREIREASDHSDPALTSKRRSVIRTAFGR